MTIYHRTILTFSIHYDFNYMLTHRNHFLKIKLDFSVFPLFCSLGPDVLSDVERIHCHKCFLNCKRLINAEASSGLLCLYWCVCTSVHRRDIIVLILRPPIAHSIKWYSKHAVISSSLELIHYVCNLISMCC